MRTKKNNSKVKKNHSSSKHSHYKIDFTGSYFVLFGLFFVGIFLPPVMSMMVIYFLQRISPKNPKLFDRNLIAFAATMFSLWLFSMTLSGVGFLNALSSSLLGSSFVIIIVYPFVFAWIHFDWNYGKHKGQI